ncbi:MAG: polysaccharide deacetylase family protein [Eubacteriales bacterium]|nr:polysaccharide deacetylase family protein [Eubacteriales bacterium]
MDDKQDKNLQAGSDFSRRDEEINPLLSDFVDNTATISGTKSDSNQNDDQSPASNPLESSALDSETASTNTEVVSTPDQSERNEKLRRLLEQRLERQKQESSPLAAQERNSAIPTEDDEAAFTPPSPIAILHSKTQALFNDPDPIDASQIEVHRIEAAKTALIREELERSKREKQGVEAAPMPVAKRRLKTDSKRSSTYPKKSHIQRRRATIWLGGLGALLIIIIVAVIFSIRREDESRYIEKFMAISESRSDGVSVSLEKYIAPNYLIRVRRPRFEDNYLDRILSMYTHNLVESFRYEHHRDAPVAAEKRATLALDFRLAERDQRLLSIVFKIDRWSERQPQQIDGNDSIVHQELFDAGFSHQTNDESQTQAQATIDRSYQYHAQYRSFYYDRYLKRLVNPDEIMDRSMSEGLLREYHMTLNENLPENLQIPETNPLRSEKNLPLLLFHNDGVEEILHWRLPSLGDDADSVKLKVPADSYEETQTQTTPYGLIPYSILNDALYMQLTGVQEEEEISTKPSDFDIALLGSQALGIDEEAKADPKSKSGEQRQANDADGEAEINNSPDGSEGDAQALSREKVQGIRTTLFMPRQNSPYYLEGQALFMDPPDPYRENVPSKSHDFKFVAFTFDDGPYNVVTPRILKQLRLNKGNATFFILGITLEGTGDLLNKIVADGNEIGNHTFYHDDMVAAGPEETAKSLALCDSAIKKICDKYPTMIRPPYGSVNEEITKIDERPFVLWSLDSADWLNQDNPQQIVQNINNRIEAGDIILMHDSHSASADAVDTLFPQLYKQGYRFVTVSQLYKIYGVPLGAGIYRSPKEDS